MAKDTYVKVEWSGQFLTTEELKRLPRKKIVSARVPAAHGMKCVRLPVADVLRIRFATVERW